MTKKEKPLSVLRHLAREVPGEIDVITTIHKLEEETAKGACFRNARSIVLVATGLLEYGLEQAIASQMVLNNSLRKKLFEGDHEIEGVIGNLASRIIIAHALDIYGPLTFADLNTVRLVRNACAHAKMDLDFSSPPFTNLSEFHASETLAKFGEDGEVPARLVPKSPVHALVQFLQYLIPYLLLHSSKDWLSSENKKGWREIFS